MGLDFRTLRFIVSLKKVAEKTLNYSRKFVNFQGINSSFFPHRTHRLLGSLGPGPVKSHRDSLRKGCPDPLLQGRKGSLNRSFRIGPPKFVIPWNYSPAFPCYLQSGTANDSELVPDAEAFSAVAGPPDVPGASSPSKLAMENSLEGSRAAEDRVKNPTW